MKNFLENNLTILVNSCDAYSDLWDAFFELFSKFGGELKKCQIVLNADSKQYSYPGLNIICPNHYTTPQPWGKRVKNCLNAIKTDYVFFLIDDFFLQSNVNIKPFYDAINWLKQNKNVVCFNFISIESAQTESNNYKDYCLMPVGTSYRFNAQAAIWNKNELNNSLLANETAWDWEILGNIRNNVISQNKELYALKYGVKSPYDYNFIQYEQSNKDHIKVISPVMKGKWATEVIDKCFRDNNINIDYKIRGFWSEQKKPNIINLAFNKFNKLIHLKRTLNNRKKAKEEYQKKYKELVTDPINKFTNE